MAHTFATGELETLRYRVDFATVDRVSDAELFGPAGTLGEMSTPIAATPFAAAS